MFSHIAYASDAKPCTYLHKNEMEPNQVEKCIEFKAWIKRPNDSDALIAKEVVVSATYNKDNLSHLYSEYGLFYFMESGKARRTISYDNGPDYFQEGLARTSWEGKIGFFDKQLTIVIPPIFDFAFPFQTGFSLVCNDCRTETDGEYKKVVGGKWGYVGKSGEIVIPIKFTKSGAMEALNKALQADG